MRKFYALCLIIVLLGISVVFLRGCKKEGDVSVVCTDVNKFEFDLGMINISSKSLGNVLLIDTSNKHVFMLGNLKASLSDIESSTRRDSMIMLTIANFRFQLSGDVVKAAANVKAEINSQIDNNTTFFLSNSVRKNLLDATKYLNNDNKVQPEKYGEPSADNPTTIIAVITSMVYADKFEFHLKKSSGVDAKINALNVDNYHLNINYSCQNSLDINAKQDGVFYKVTYFTFSSNRFKFLSTSIKLNEYHTEENALQKSDVDNKVIN